MLLFGGCLQKSAESKNVGARRERNGEREREREKKEREREREKRKRKRVNDLGGGKRERIPRNQKNGEKRGTTHVDQHEKDETRESDTVLGRNDGADDGAEKTQLRRVEMRARDGTAR